MMVNCITLAVVKGFQKEVRDKVIGFGSHAVITKSGEHTLFESEPISIHQTFLPSLKQSSFVKHIQPVAYKPALLQSNITEKNPQIQQEIEGVLVKGVDETYDWDFFTTYLKQGRLPNFKTKIPSQEILISSKIALDLHYQLGDQVRTFFVKNKPVKKLFTIVGIYETGYEEMDKQIIIGDLRNIQQLNDWGLQVGITVADTLKDNQLIIKAEVVGGNGMYRYDWGRGYEPFGGFTYYPTKDTVIRVIVSDYWMHLDESTKNTTIPDTAYLKIDVDENINSFYPYQLEDGQLKRNYLDNDGYQFQLMAGPHKIKFTKIDGIGSFQNYVGAYECSLKNWESLHKDLTKIKQKVLVGKNALNLKVTSITESQNDIFVWLGFLDINVIIILTLMLLIGIINMGSAMLVMILVKTNFIGLMKAIGASNWSIRSIFLHSAFYLIVRGMIWGNILGIGLCVLQKYGKVIRLNPEVYYLNAVPVQLDFWNIIFLNLLTIAVCLIMLLIPSAIITKISPSKSIKFN